MGLEIGAWQVSWAWACGYPPTQFETPGWSLFTNLKIPEWTSLQNQQIFSKMRSKTGQIDTKGPNKAISWKTAQFRQFPSTVETPPNIFEPAHTATKRQSIKSAISIGSIHRECQYLPTIPLLSGKWENR